MKDYEPCFSAEDLREAVGGVWWNGVMPGVISGIGTDTRLSLTGKMFLALCGENFDAHDFLDRALMAGAAALCVAADKVEKIPADCPVPVLLVTDPLEAYQALGRFHRLRFPDLKVAAVTGSVGKTSVKEMLRAIFRAACDGDDEKVLATAGNTNNQIGVPQNLLRLREWHRFAVIEMGTNHPGEIAPLSRTALPECAVISAIAPCHLEFLGSLEGVAREKSHIWDGLPPGGAAVMPANCAGQGILAERAAQFRIYRFGLPAAGAEVTAEYLGGDLVGSRFRLHMAGRSWEIQWKLSGAHQALNAAAAAATAWALGVAPEVIAAGLPGTTLPGMRMARREAGGVIYINDAYNASPESMLAAFRQLAESMEPKRLLLVLGDMLELGAVEAAEHRKMLETVRLQLPGARLLAVGPRFATAAQEVDPAILQAQDSIAAAAMLEKLVHPGDTVFLKGSRGMALENILPVECRDKH